MQKTYSTKQFHYDASTRTFTAELSDLSVRAGDTAFYQVYPDSCDEGLVLVSHVTGIEVKYVVSETIEGQSWTLVPARGQLHLPRTALYTKMILFND